MPELRVHEQQFIYEPDGPVLAEFVADRSKLAVICGPVGSGSSTGSLMRLWFTACEQRPSSIDGKRRSKWFIIRPTYPELQTSTLKTWLFWFPEERYGRLIRSRPMNQMIQVGDVEAEFWFLALDGPDDIEKARSTEWTGGFMNELEFQSYDIFQEMRSRSGRFPSRAEGGCTWSGVIGDMNAPNEDHFIARMAGWAEYPDETPQEKRLKWPSDWWLKKQPPGLIEVFGPDGVTVVDYVENPEAENLKWLEPGYYKHLAKGATKRWIDARIMNRVSFLTSGDPVWPGYREELHLSRRPLAYVPDREVVVALDFGRRPCALICQEVGDKIHVQKEFRMYGVGAATFAPALKRFLEQNYRGAKLRFTGDPKGRDKGQADERSAYDIFASFGMPVSPAPVRNNNLDDRLESVAYALLTNRVLISPECTTLRGAMAGKYVFKKLETGEAEPVKDKYSDVADCLQYLCLFMGEGRRMIGLSAVQVAHAVKVANRRSLRRISA